MNYYCCCYGWTDGCSCAFFLCALMGGGGGDGILGVDSIFFVTIYAYSV